MRSSCPRLVLALACACGPTASVDGDGGDDGADGDSTGRPTVTATSTAADPPEPGDSTSEPTPRGPDLGGLPPAAPNCACEEAIPEPFEIGCGYDSLFEHGPPCDLDLLCDEVWVECSRPGADLYACVDGWSYAEAEQVCALQALRDGTPGVLHIQGTNDFGLFSDTDIHVVRILDDGRLMVNTCMSTDVGAQWNPTRAYGPVDPTYFDACLPLEAPERHDCLLEAIAKGSQPLDPCP